MTDKAEHPRRALLPGWQATFGPFRIVPARKQLLLGERVVQLGGRAYDLLQLLVENAGEFVDKQALFDRAWPNFAIEETSLRTAMTAVRKVLREDGSGRNYIETDPGRGYRLAVDVALDTGTSPLRGLPRPPARVIGRDAVVAALVAEYLQRRLVTIVGPGGIGKTTVALLTASQIANAQRFDAVTFVDFSMLHDPMLVPHVIRSALDHTGKCDDGWDALRAAVAHQSRLLLLDGCETVLPVIRAELPRLLDSAPGLAVLATSREPLSAPGERVWRLAPLSTPAPYAPLTVDEALHYSAVELFVDRARRASSRFELTDTNVVQVASICRRLDGLPLAIELAAGRLDGFDVTEFASELTDYFRLHMPGRSAAPLRHRTLRATLDWSHDALSSRQRILLRRLSIFCGIITAEKVRDVVSDGQLPESEVSTLVESLGAKSLLSAGPDEARGQYIFLGTTRAYALEKLEEAGETNTFALRHARYVADTLRKMAASPEQKGSKWLNFCVQMIDEIGCALDWLASRAHLSKLTLELTLASLPVWTRLGHYTEAINRLRNTNRFTTTLQDLGTSAAIRREFSTHRRAVSMIPHESQAQAAGTAGQLDGQRMTDVTFGPFRLNRSHRQLYCSDKPVRLGDPSYKVLEILVDRPGETIDNLTLIESVWGSLNVDDSNLRHAVAALRRALAKAGCERTYVTTVPRRGYRFCEPVSPSPPTAVRRWTPAPTPDVVGRTDLVADLVEDLRTNRLISVVGAGGMGKTTVAQCVARKTLERGYVDYVAFVDLAPVRTRDDLLGAVLRDLGVSASGDDPWMNLERFLDSRRMLVVVDGCDHVIERVAPIVENILLISSNIRLLCTSREPLRAADEHRWRLKGLPVASEMDGLTAIRAIEFAAVELFVERAKISNPNFQFTNGSAPYVAFICRRLDGCPLAIELAAARMDVFELPALAQLVDSPFLLQMQKCNGASSRHVSLAATLDWSFKALSLKERIVLRRLAVFNGPFTFDAARQVAGFGEVRMIEVSDIVAQLAAKSLVDSDADGVHGRRRLCHTVRIYAGEKLDQSGEREVVARRYEQCDGTNMVASWSATALAGVSP
ncbi:hypothetical protein AA23498_1097 [Acetobacter nitrogenifigens DSM 23921 = NBRC 105050]|uniref:OmpR/PhoB-type domain-containing protein n=1 Tax=Acetobacter nitrogenifigens DSM 23921 = NBRC 105050 TaxID=1120919 RepID=A0A511XAM4_9PROT|nr:winged helix-turn-helix domain-containing protein [Acetobacter nitrogenifigens]GBQ91151.1 hypothetical protein AA23498_1097 [Acetobacter nitrogenifigens DSM 23921 = NBRC 105050]GEN59975.1 hypothetical protein ANI02nite_18590 [Acetobacter nitrogenifigens DSM 23921 = NBRC 105050]